MPIVTPRRRFKHVLALVALSALPVVASVASAATTDRSMADNRGFFGRIGHYLANNSYGSLGVLHFDYIGDSNDLHADGVLGPALVGGNTRPDSGTSISDETTAGATIGIFIPKTAHHLSIEFGLAPPIEFGFQVDGSARNIGSQGLAGLALGGPVGKRVGTFKSLPPNFTLVFRPFTDTVIQPYVGAGAMWLHTYDQNISNSRFDRAAKVLNATKAKLDLSQPWACIAQAGFDVELPKPLFFKFDARYVGCATVDADVDLGTVKAGGTGPLPGAPTGLPAGTNLGSVTTSNDFEAMIYQVSFGVNF